VEENEYILEMENVCKTFPGVAALKNISLKVRRGTTHAIMGENGAGKSTMMKVLLGIYKRDSGIVRFRGEDVNFKGPGNALQSGLAMIHQELSTVRELRVYENIFLGKELTFGKTGIKREKAMIRETKELFDRLGINMNPQAKMGTLSVAQQQLCEIAKAISYNAELIIMDEPTSAITESEVEHLFGIIRNLSENKRTVIYITHKMDEVFQITDEISVYRDGEYINTVKTIDTSKDQLISMMVGRSIDNLFPKLPAEIGEIYLKVEGLSRENEFKDVSFEVRRGEILGVAGLMGAGRSEVMETLFGCRKKNEGRIFIGGKEINITSPKDAIMNGIGLLTEDRKHSGCFLPLSVKFNTCIASMREFAGLFFAKKMKIDEAAEEMRKRINIKTPSVNQKIVNLSGGNQQKVLVGRWLLTDPDILIMDEPTRGIDVGAKAEIHKLISTLAAQGKCIIMISSELPEIMGMSDRVMVMCEGRMMGIIDKDDITQEKVMRYATGEYGRD